jgi:branched-chain amino acid transport system permease protein
MTLPSLNLLLQAILSGIFIGGLYGLIGLGLGLTRGLLRQINLSHFGLVFLGGYLSYQMAASWRLDPLLALVIVPPLFFASAPPCSGCFALPSRPSTRCW